METQKRVIVVGEDASERDLVARWIVEAGFQCESRVAGQELLSEPLEDVAAICLQFGSGEVGSGAEPALAVLHTLLGLDPALPVLVLCNDDDPSGALSAMRAGAYDCLVGPLVAEQVVRAVSRAVERRLLTFNVRRLEAERVEGGVGRPLLGQSVRMRELNRQLARVAEGELPIRIVGEAGTGKELVARSLHGHSRRRMGPFVAINCAALTAGTQGVELFGHDGGAGSVGGSSRRGAFELARGGTIFLDALDSLPLAIQADLLRVVQERSLRRVGGQSEISVDCRILWATHGDLEKDVAAGRFRDDLYSRLVLCPVTVPALRERREDVPLLAGHFLRELKGTLGARVERIHPEALDALVSYDWPGNVRELQNIISRAMVSSDGDAITLAQLPSNLRSRVLTAQRDAAPAWAPESQERHSLRSASPRVGPEEMVPREEDIVPVEALERREILRALSATRGNVARAARLLGLGRATLYRRIAELEGPSPVDEKEVSSL